MSNFFMPRNALVTRASCSFEAVRIHLVEVRRNDLPGHAVAILQPAALLGFGHGRQCVPVAIDLVLAVATDHERDRFVEREVVVPGAVHGGKGLTGELER